MTTTRRYTLPLLVALGMTAGAVGAQTNSATVTLPTSDRNTSAPPSPTAENAERPRKEAVDRTPTGKTNKKRARSPLAVDPRAAVKETPEPAIELPGVMRLDGERADAIDYTRVRVIAFANNVNRTVHLAADGQNRIQLPFKNPRIAGTEAIVIDKRPESNNVYISFDHEYELKPVHVWIEGPNNIAMGLELVPKEIPAQLILVEDKEGLFNGQAAKRRADSYVSQTQNLMETACLGGALSGYTTIDLQLDKRLPPIALNGLVVTPLRQFSGRDNDLYIYQIDNPGPNTVRVREKEFEGPNVAAISICVLPVLEAGETTRVQVLTRKETAQ